MKISWLGAVLGATLLAAPVWARADADEDKVKEAFAALQAGIKAGDVDKLWPLLDTTTQKAVEKAATALAAEYDKAKPEGKAQLEKLFGLSAEEMGKLKTEPKLFVKTKRFIGKWHEVPGSKVDKVTVSDDKATLNYTEDDGDKEKLEFVKQDGKWKAVLPKVM
jgi:hypothetical protein